MLGSKTEKPAGSKNDLLNVSPIEIAEVRQLIPCIAMAKYRVLAQVQPTLETLGDGTHFPKGLILENVGALTIDGGKHHDHCLFNRQKIMTR
jgi:ArsR family metal-binding transcriptional regulator